MSLAKEIMLLEPDLDEVLLQRGCAVAVSSDGYGMLINTLSSRGALEDDPERACALKQGLEALSAEARAVVNIVFNVPQELVDFVAGKDTSKGLTAHDVKAWLRWCGWEWQMIRSAFAEVKKLLTSL